jgi:hypothetical protein
VSKRWSQADIDWLIANYPNTDNRDVAKKLARTMDGCKSMAYMHGLKKSREWIMKCGNNAAIGRIVGRKFPPADTKLLSETEIQKFYTHVSRVRLRRISDEIQAGMKREAA